jgi:hypothetical protein
VPTAGGDVVTVGLPPIAFRFDAGAHEYVDTVTGYVYPHATGLLLISGWTDDRWFTDESSERGQAVHRMTAEYDMGAIEQPHAVESGYKNYLLGHVDVVQRSKPVWLHIEEPIVSARYRFGCRPDRICTYYGGRGPWEVKAAQPQKSHQIQTALQALADEARSGIPAEYAWRFCEYLTPNGRGRVVQHKDVRDIIEARRIVREYCR